MNHGCKNSGHTACYNGGQTAREKSRKHNHESVALRLPIMGRIHPCMRISCKGELGNAWQNAFCVYILSVCTKLDVYLQCILGKWFLLGSTSGRLQADVALTLGFASSSCLRTCFTWKLGEMLNRQSLSCSWYKSAAIQHSIVFSFPDSCRGTITQNQ
jgi:hypothetical protein